MHTSSTPTGITNSNRSYKDLVLIFFLLYSSFILSLDVILFPVLMVRLSVKHMFALKVKKHDFTDVFVDLGENPTDVTSDHIYIHESFVLQLYGLRHYKFGADRLDQFKKSTFNDLYLLPPSKETLCQHIYHASYQARYLWKQSVEELDIPDPEQRGCKTDCKGDQSVFLDH